MNVAAGRLLAEELVFSRGTLTPQFEDPLVQGVIVGVAVIMMLIGAVPIRHAFAHWRGTTHPLDVITDGPVRVVGTVSTNEDNGSLVSPLSGEDVVLYEYEVQEYTDTEECQGWEPVAGGADAIPFVLEDDSGAVAVDPAGSTLMLGNRTSQHVDLRNDPSSGHAKDTTPEGDADQKSLTEEQLVTRHDPGTGQLHVGSVTLQEGSRYRLKERRIEPGDNLVVTGTAEDGNHMPLISDRNGNGRLFGSLFEYPFVVSDTPELRSARYLLKRGAAWAGVGGIGLLLGLELEMLVPTALVIGVFFGALLRSPGWCWVVTVAILLFGETTVENTSEPLFLAPAAVAVALSLLVSGYALWDDSPQVSLKRDHWQPSARKR